MRTPPRPWPGPACEAAGLLDALHREGLLTETGHRRYGLHDLLRRYAARRPNLQNAGQALAGARADRASLLACLDYRWPRVP